MSDVISAGTVFIGRSLRHSARDIESLVMSVTLPVMLMLLFTYVFGGAVAGDPASYAAYVVPGTVLLCAGFGAATTAVGVANDLSGGMVDRLRRMPVPAWTLLVGHVVASLVRNLVATAIVLGVGVLLGFRPTAGLLGWIGAIGVIAAWVLAVTAVFALIGLLSGSPEAANGYGFIVLFLPYVSSAFVPVDTLPTWMRGFAEHQPVTPVIESVRALLAGNAPGPDLWWALGWALGLLVVATALMAYVFPRRRSRAA
ncbi:MAG TPA: ABC transporter permease [Ornithinibacter sp.]|jgi:ABC-2 type transport system permease protein|nr:ABC transporter permease [Ornithinibacter sp.]